MRKPFLYLVQAKAALPPAYAELDSDRSCMRAGFWGAERPSSLHMPGTTWTSGRNRLLASAMSSVPDHDYVVFLDDDVAFKRGDWRQFEDLLLRDRPLVAAPRLEGYSTPTRPDFPVQTTYCFDGCYNAFHTSIIRNGVLLPYVERFDQKSWHFSQLILIHLAAVLYPGAVAQYNEIVVTNTAHGLYPQDLSFSEAPLVEEWLKANILRPSLRRRWRMKPYLGGATRVAPRRATPQRPLETASLQQLLRPDWRGALRGDVH